MQLKMFNAKLIKSLTLYNWISVSQPMVRIPLVVLEKVIGGTWRKPPFIKKQIGSILFGLFDINNNINNNCTYIGI